LSKVASDKLTNNNPNIADLSDENRAFRVGEKLSELYSNEWSDAYEELTEGGRRSDIQAINILLEILKVIVVHTFLKLCLFCCIHLTQIQTMQKSSLNS
jgi:hypothetical protein